VQSVKSFDLIVIIVFTYYRGVVNIRDLEYFLAVAEFQHFGKAAKHCHVSQPTLSGQLKKLEAELDVSLFERSNRRVMITKAGKQIIPYAKRTMR